MALRQDWWMSSIATNENWHLLKPWLVKDDRKNGKRIEACSKRLHNHCDNLVNILLGMFNYSLHTVLLVQVFLCMIPFVTEESFPLIFLFVYIPVVVFFFYFPWTVWDTVGKLMLLFLHKQIALKQYFVNKQENAPVFIHLLFPVSVTWKGKDLSQKMEVTRK